MTELLRWFWLLPIAATIANAVVIRMRANKHIREKPELKMGYNRMLKALILWASFPWIVMGLGCVVGGVPNVLHYLKPDPGNVYVVSVYASYAVTLVAFAWWIFRGNGVQMLLDHPGFFRAPIQNEFVIKLFTAFIVLVWFTDMTADIPLDIS